MYVRRMYVVTTPRHAILALSLKSSQVHNMHLCTTLLLSDAGTGGREGSPGAGTPLPPPPIFGRSVNPIPTGEGRISPPINTGTPNVFHLPASLDPNQNLNDFYALTQ